MDAAADKVERRREQDRRRHAANREKRFARKLKRRYMLHPAQYEAMRAGQSGGCAVCGEACATGKRLAVDHHHETGIIRGLLCAACNTSAGAMKDSPQLLRKLADYIEAGGTPAFDIVTFYQRAMETTNERN